MVKSFFAEKWLVMEQMRKLPIGIQTFKEAIKVGKFSSEEARVLRDGLQEVAGMGAVQNYGCPSVEGSLKEKYFVLG